MAFIVIALGAWTRLVDAGLGCPDWPGCYGFIVFQPMKQKLQLRKADIRCSHVIKQSNTGVVHRYFAALGLIAILPLSYNTKR